LIGNPSDGYFGRTIAFCFKNFSAEIEMWESPELELLPSRRDHSVFKGLDGLREDVKSNGYYGGFRLLKASCKAFGDYCERRGIELPARNFTMRYRSNIPNRVGLAGSSGIITACMRSLMGFYNVQISRHSLANLVLSVENEELAIPAGLQDRVAQAYEVPMFMDFDRKLMEERGYGNYEPIDLAPFADYLYVAYREDLSEGTEVYHNDLRTRYRQGKPEVMDAIQRWADLSVQFRDLVAKTTQAEGVVGELSKLVNANFDQRASLYDVGDGNRTLVSTARKFGASAKFAGSGGAIVGFLPEASNGTFAKMSTAFERIGVQVLRPELV
jgi:glucuronokinase